MGIQIEFNPDLALRKFGTEGREINECLPEKLEIGKVYNFLKQGDFIDLCRGPHVQRLSQIGAIILVRWSAQRAAPVRVGRARLRRG